MDRTAKLIGDEGDVGFVVCWNQASQKVFGDGRFVNMPLTLFPKNPSSTIDVKAPE